MVTIAKSKMATPKNKKENKSPKSVKKSPGMTPIPMKKKTPKKTSDKIADMVTPKKKKTPKKISDKILDVLTPDITPKKTSDKIPDILTPDMTPGKTPKKKKTPKKASDKTPSKTSAKTLDETPKMKVKKRKLSNEERETTSPVAKVQAVASDSDKPSLPNSVALKVKQEKKELSNMASRDVDLTKFSLVSKALYVSLFDPATKELLEVLSEVKDISIKRVFSVMCRDEEQREQMMLKITELPQSDNYKIICQHEKKERKVIFLYGMGLSPQTTNEDIMNVCKTASSCFVFDYQRYGSACRVAKIKFDSPEKLEEIAKQKTMTVCGKNVHVDTNWSNLRQRIKVMQAKVEAKVETKVEVNGNEKKMSKTAVKKSAHKKVVKKEIEGDTESD